MKRIQLHLSILLIATSVLSLTGCSSDENAPGSTDDYVEIAGEADITATVPDAEEASGLLQNTGMGIENGNYYATLFRGDAPLDITDMKELRMDTNDEDCPVGVIIDLSELDYTVVELDRDVCVLGAGEYTYEDDPFNLENYYYYDKEIWLSLSSIENAYHPDGVEGEVEGDVTFYTSDWKLNAVLEYNDTVAVSASIYFDSINDVSIPELKEDIQTIYSKMTFEDISGESAYYSTIKEFDSIQFDCGWNIAGIEMVDWGINNVTFSYNSDCYAFFSVAKRSGKYIDSGVVSLVPLTDSNGNDIGYTKYDEDPHGNCEYYIRQEDGSYMDVYVSGSCSSDDNFPLEWGTVEAMLKNDH